MNPIQQIPMQQIPMQQMPMSMQISMQQVPVCSMMGVSYPYPHYVMASNSASSSFDNRQTHHLCPPEKTLWMGSIDSEKWNAEFLTEAFGIFGYKVQNVKMVTEKGSERPASYCFVEFATEDDARNAMLKCSGRTIRNDPERRRFHLSFANSPDPSSEFNIFVNNLSKSVDDIDLFRIFGEKYKSCRGAKVYKTHDGVSKESGFVRFMSETDQQLALVEMNKVKLKGREMILKLAHPKIRSRDSRSGRGSYSSNNSHYGGAHPNRSYYPSSSSRGYRRERSPLNKRSPPRQSKHYVESVEPPTVDEHNEHMFKTDWDYQMALDSARFSKYLISPDVKAKELAVKLYE